MTSKLLKIISEINILPKISIDKPNRVITFIEEGLFGNNLTEAYWMLKGYNIRKSEEPEPQQSNQY